MSSSEPVVEISFSFNGVPQVRGVSITDPAPIDINEVAPDAMNSNTSFGYSGRHDHGSLPLLNNDPRMGRLVSALQEAKKQCDDFLTAEIAKVSTESGPSSNKQSKTTGSPAEKKPRLEGSGDNSGAIDDDNDDDAI
jgi:hypothetical protein